MRAPLRASYVGVVRDCGAQRLPISWGAKGRNRGAQDSPHQLHFILVNRNRMGYVLYLAAERSHAIHAGRCFRQAPLRFGRTGRLGRRAGLRVSEGGNKNARAPPGFGSAEAARLRFLRGSRSCSRRPARAGSLEAQRTRSAPPYEKGARGLWRGRAPFCASSLDLEEMRVPHLAVAGILVAFLAGGQPPPRVELNGSRIRIEVTINNGKLQE